VILVDSSIWIDHLHHAERVLVTLLGDDEVGCHPLNIKELALGSIKERDGVLDLFANLYHRPCRGAAPDGCAQVVGDVLYKSLYSNGGGAL